MTKRDAKRPIRAWTILFGLVVLCFLSAIAGGAIVRKFGVSNETISYVEFISIMLSAISVILTALAIFLAVLGVVGWNSIRGNISQQTLTFLEEGFKEGNSLHEMIRQRTTEIMFQGVAPINLDKREPE